MRRLRVGSVRDLPVGVLRQAGDALLNLFFPESCLVCAAPVSRHTERSVCAPCWSRILQLAITPPWCPVCGIPFAVEVTASHVCGRCILEPPPYAGARSFALYTGELRTIVHALKFHGRRNLCALLAPALASTYFESWRPDEIDFIVPVPLDTRRKRERGFNQAALLAHALVRCLGVPCREEVLRRVRSTAPQVGLSPAERARNVRGAFVAVAGPVLDGARVLLVDDVLTTGATVASAARALLAGGALRVSVLTAARAVEDC